MRTKLVTVVIAASLVANGIVLAAPNPDAVVGVWYTDGKDCKIEIYKKDTKYNGKIVWLKNPTYEAGHPEAGKPRHDAKNPDAAHQLDPMIGLNLLRDFTFDGQGSWTGGTIYDPENGKTYKCVMTVGDENTLNGRGYLGIQAFGRTTSWTRVPKDEKTDSSKTDSTKPEPPKQELPKPATK